MRAKPLPTQTVLLQQPLHILQAAAQEALANRTGTIRNVGLRATLIRTLEERITDITFGILDEQEYLTRWLEDKPIPTPENNP